MTKAKSLANDEGVGIVAVPKNEESKEESKEDVVQEVEGEVKVEKKKAVDISSLPGVGAATAEKLKDAGYVSLMNIAVASPGEIIELTGLSELKAKKLIKCAMDGLDMGFETGSALLKRREQISRISTSSSSFDTMLGGGFETGSITEVFSEYGGGKTQIAHILSVSVQKAYNDAVVIFVDTESTFRPERIEQIAGGMGLDPKKALANIRVARAFNSDHQAILAEKIEDLIKNDGLNIKLIIVDSLTAHFRAEFIGRGTLADRQQKLNRHMHTLAKLAEQYNVCVYVTNQVMAKPDQFFGDPTEAIGGHIVGHNSQTRVYLRKGKKGSRVAKLVDSPHLPDGECNFFVTETGLKDV